MNEGKYPPPPRYVEHPGTIRVAGSSSPLRLAQCAQTFISESVEPIDFFFIGGNAGQQAMKAMTILCFQIEHESNGACSALFKPMRVLTNTVDPVSKKEIEKDGTVWRLSLIS